MPGPSSVTSMHTSSPTATVTVSVVAGRAAASLTALADNGFRVIGQAASTTDSGPLNCAEVRSPAGELRDGLIEALSQPGDVRGRAMQVEDRGADLLNDLLQIVHAVGQSLLHLGDRVPAGWCPASASPTANSRWITWSCRSSGDAVAIGEHIEFTHPALGGRQLPSERGLVGEGGHHVELLVG